MLQIALFIPNRVSNYISTVANKTRQNRNLVVCTFTTNKTDREGTAAKVMSENGSLTTFDARSISYK